MPTERKIIGNEGEELVSRFLMKHGLKVMERNYLKPWGEIDIVASDRQKRIHFVEVKAKKISDLTQKYGEFRPEDHMHAWKVKRFKRIIETWLMDKDYDGEWQIDVAIAYVSDNKELESVDMFWDVVL